MENKPYVDVWHGEGVMTLSCCTILSGKSEMRRLKKLGAESIRMYVDYPDGRRFYYSFDKDGKIRKEDNNLDN